MLAIAYMLFPLQLKQYTIQGKPVEVFAPDAKAVHDAYKNGCIPFPYWSQVWPAAIGLSEFLLRHPHYTQNKKVVELAAGIGLPSMVAARNATAVICSDYLPEAIQTAQQSAEHNGLHNLSVRLLDWNELPEDVEADVLLLSDVNYDPVVFEVQQKMIRSFLQKGTVVILCTPQRLMAKNFITPLLSFCALQEEIKLDHQGKEVAVTIIVLSN